MSKTITLLISAALLMVINVRGQTATPILTLIGSSGDANSTISWSLGEVATQNDDLSTTGQHLTHGFQQVFIKEDTTGINENVELSYSANIYPNPAQNKLNIEIVSKTPINHIAQLTAANGQLIYETVINISKAEINIEAIAAGNYLLTIASKTHPTEKRTFKIIKN
jgi:hypothetical protein